MRFVKGLLLFVLVVVVILAVVLGSGYLYLTRRAIAQTDGTVQLPGLRAPVTVIRDKSGIPHIYASTPADLFAAQGWVHASERMWQMEIWRRLGGDLKPPHLANIAGETVALADVIAACEKVMDRKARGRVVVDCK